MSAVVSVPRPEEIDLIISDVDGTLLDSHHRLHPRTYHALDWLRRNKPQLPIVIATGKQRSAVGEIRTPLNLDVFPASHLNGCVVYQPHGKVQVEVGLDLEILIKLYTEYHAAQVTMLYYDRDRVYEVPGSDGLVWGEKMRGFGEHVHTVDASFIDKIKDGSVNIIKAAICHSAGARMESFRASLKSEYSATAFTLTQAVPFCLELIPTTGSKGIALAKIIGTSLDPRRVIAFGDGENDVSMFKVAGYSVAMANAMTVAKENATHNTLSSDEGGVGAFLEKIYGIEYSEKSYDYWLNRPVLA
ncbi:Putative uncharacterized protein [Taphrina deformans PYCC 5710]|uniref:Uncharacterized protein n=1 Tax=Taphrina deformans (strain PYCC 5710 / ATCC 11124 / CBS 356.35 / IMI 108563 / JCM 9778 / NBRC 8474) TaxID=1097556 RepID=R4XD27_TAPDE|nr:Putative uncharacterized protein [Taphrina deformans PYCC 5710]|eukprot:CCG81225.1 Putative uncharacterized protein [Taphrina deformans PYCC 5710]